MFRTRMMQMLALGSLVLLPASANASGHERTVGPPIALTVQNDNFYDVHVYAMRDGVYESMGMVLSFTTARFEIPERFTTAGADFRLLADPIGGSGVYVSDPILIAPGQGLKLTVQNALDLSTVIVQ